jgi:hypothetical protein
MISIITTFLKIFNAEFVGMFMVCPHVRFQMLIASGSLVVIVELKLNIDFMQPNVTRHSFMVLSEVALVSLPPHRFVRLSCGYYQLHRIEKGRV